MKLICYYSVISGFGGCSFCSGCSGEGLQYKFTSWFKFRLTSLHRTLRFIQNLFRALIFIMRSSHLVKRCVQSSFEIFFLEWM